jgi:predicted small secreted protein
MKRTLLLVVLLASLTGCNTIQGIGQDIKDGGAAMSHAINGNSSSDKDFNK